MAQVLSLVTLSIETCHRDEFLTRAKDELKAYWEAHGSERYEAYEEMGPTGPTGRVVELNVLKDRDAYLQLSRFVQEGEGLPAVAYRHAKPVQWQVLEQRT